VVSHIIVSGKEVACDAPVVLWGESGLRFDALAKRSSTTAVVLHHTSGSNLAPGVHHALKTRRDPRTGKLLNLSVHFVVEPNGTVYQFCDASMRCAHAGSADDTNQDGVRVSGNSTTIGIEIVNPALRSAPPRGLPRPMITETIHGEKATVTGFTPAQVTSTIALVRSLCRAYGLPFAFPMDGAAVLATTMPELEFKAFRGVLGHLHLTSRKRDPGIAIFDELRKSAA